MLEQSWGKQNRCFIPKAMKADFICSDTKKQKIFFFSFLSKYSRLETEVFKRDKQDGDKLWSSKHKTF